MAQEILLESGTNEVEILEFMLDDQSFGINVVKVMQIIAYDETKFTSVPGAADAYLGVYQWHGKTIPLINLNAALHRTEKSPPKRPVILVTRFNEVFNSFLIGGVNRIHRVNWDQIDPVNQVIETYSSSVTGSAHVMDRDILLVDFEFIVADLFPETKMVHYTEESKVADPLKREEVRLVFAEDSTFIRNNVTTILQQVGYRNISAFENGQQALDHLISLKKKASAENRPINDLVSLIITDIEMPQMDGLTLCRKLKQELGIKDVPVAIFSSLIDEQMKEKCKSVGADIYSSKPKINELVKMIDTLLHIN